MRISDWSSDVCSSDLRIDGRARANRVTFTGTGIWDISRTWIALLLTGNCTDIESIFHRSVTNSEGRSEEHTSELQSLMRISYAVFCLKKKRKKTIPTNKIPIISITLHSTQNDRPITPTQHRYLTIKS